MSDPNYKRTSGYSNWMKKRYWPAQIGRNNIATMVDGRQYQVRDDGWRRIYPQLQEKK